MTTPNPIPERDFRDALGSFATGVCVIAAQREDGAAIGLTVNSFTSVSLDPPLALVCLGVGSGRTQALASAERFAITILAADQQALSNHFAGRGEGLVPDGDWHAGANGAPVLNNAAASIECDFETTHPGGDHIIVVGRITAVNSDPGKQPLMYFRGGYRELAPVLG